MATKILVLTEWMIDEFGANVLRCIHDHPLPSPSSWTDDGGQVDMLPDPSVGMAVGIVDDTQFAEIEADPNILILTAENI